MGNEVFITLCHKGPGGAVWAVPGLSHQQETIMDTSNNLGEPILGVQFIFNVDLLGREAPDFEERVKYVITRTFAELAKTLSGEKRVDVAVLWDRGVWRRDPETSLPSGTLWSADMSIRALPVQQGDQELLPPLRSN